MTGDKDELHIRGDLLYLFHEIKPAHPRQSDIQHGQVIPVFGNQADGIIAVYRPVSVNAPESETFGQGDSQFPVRRESANSSASI